MDKGIHYHFPEGSTVHAIGERIVAAPDFKPSAIAAAAAAAIDQPAPKKRVHAFDLLAAQPWAILPDTLSTMAAIARRENDSIESVEARLGRPLQNTRTVSIRDGVAVVPVTGPIFRYANLFTQISGATSLDVLARDFTAAVDDPAVKAIVLNIDSPGGQASGISEFAALVRASGKPVTAYVDGMAASAAYWIAAAAQHVVMSKTAMAGSIGAVLTVDTSKSGNAVEIVSSQSPNKRPDVTTSEGRAQIQRLIDALAQVFVEDVAAFRKVSADTVLEKFGGGDVFLAAEAVARGMADKVSTLEEVIAGLSGSTPKGVIHMSANTDAPAINRAFLAENHAELLAEILSEGAAVGAEKERTRILDIQSRAKGFPGHDDLVASLIADGKTTGVEAAAQILEAERGRGAARLAALKSDAPPPVPHGADSEPAAASDLPVDEQARADWDAKSELREEFGKFETYLAYAKAHASGQVKVLGKSK